MCFTHFQLIPNLSFQYKVNIYFSKSTKGLWVGTKGFTTLITIIVNIEVTAITIQIAVRILLQRVASERAIITQISDSILIFVFLYSVGPVGTVVLVDLNNNNE